MPRCAAIIYLCRWLARFLAPSALMVWNFLNDLGSRISDVTFDKRDTDFLFQRLSIALQKGNAACMYKSGPLIGTLE